jgi:hypothetical protein
VITDRLDVTSEAFAAATGWEIKPEGACRGEVCVPLEGGAFDVVATAARLGMAVVHDDDAGVWAIGPETIGGRALTTAEAPDLELPDVVTGQRVRLSSLRGSKVIIAAWAPY